MPPTRTNIGLCRGGVVVFVLAVIFVVIVVFVFEEIGVEQIMLSSSLVMVVFVVLFVVVV